MHRDDWPVDKKQTFKPIERTPFMKKILEENRAKVLYEHVSVQACELGYADITEALADLEHIRQESKEDNGNG